MLACRAARVRCIDWGDEPGDGSSNILLSTSSELVGDTAGMVGGSSPRSSSEVREGNRSSSDSVLEAEGNRWARLQPE